MAYFGIVRRNIAGHFTRYGKELRVRFRSHPALRVWRIRHDSCQSQMLSLIKNNSFYFLFGLIWPMIKQNDLRGQKIFGIEVYSLMHRNKVLRLINFNGRQNVIFWLSED